jgi:hypothetical protein
LLGLTLKKYNICTSIVVVIGCYIGYISKVLTNPALVKHSQISQRRWKRPEISGTNNRGTCNQVLVKGSRGFA